jgi:single-strand DNA-binding protein
MSVNKVILVGNVGKDPETRYLDEGTAFTKFSMATSETYKNKAGERVSTTEWHNVILWRGLAQVAEKYVKKGTQIYIEGRIKTRSYDDQDGNKKYITEIVGEQMQLLSRKPDDAGEQGGNQGVQNSQAAQSNPAAQTSPAAQSNPATQTSPAGQSGGTAESGNKNPEAFGEGDNGPDDLPF